MIFLSFNLVSQNISESVIKEYEDTLCQIAYTIMHGENEDIRRDANSGFISELKEILKYKQSYQYSFDSLITISILSPEDNSFRIFNWILRKDNGEYDYFAIILIPQKNKSNMIITLKDESKNILNPEKEILNQDNWYGALYYDIISIKKKNNQYYTLLAWDGYSNEITRKIIDIIQIQKDSIVFGKNIFQRNNETRNRVILEYNANTSISLRYEKSKKRIIFDHLVPLKENQEGFNQFYVPDGSYDSYNYKNGKWEYKTDIDIRGKDMSPENNKKTNSKGLFGE